MSIQITLGEISPSSQAYKIEIPVSICLADQRKLSGILTLNVREPIPFPEYSSLMPPWKQNWREIYLPKVYQYISNIWERTIQGRRRIECISLAPKRQGRRFPVKVKVEGCDIDGIVSWKPPRIGRRRIIKIHQV